MKQNHPFLEIERVCEAIASLTGLSFTLEQWPLLNASLEAASIELSFANKQDFIQFILSTPLSTLQIETLTRHITISETYFWREPQVFEAFAKVIEEFVASKIGKDKIINIWCAACSTGEEAYSIAIAIHRAISNIKQWKINFYATDNNSTSLELAKKGEYSDWAFRNSPAWLKNNYFKSMSDGKFEIIPEIKSMLTFSKFDLNQKNYTGADFLTSKMDIIFCQNVLKYFTTRVATKVVQSLYSVLSTKGWLVVSSFELSSLMFPMFAPVNFPGVVFYRKPQKKLSAAPDMLKIEQNKMYFDSSPLGIVDTASEGNLNTTCAKSNHQVYFVEEGVPTSETVTSDNLLPKQSIKTMRSNLEEQKEAIRKLANQGKLEQALLNCSEAIEVNLLAPDLYFLHATIQQQLNKNSEAMASLKQAIYLKPNYLICHFTMGNLLIRQGDFKTANLYFNNTLDLLNSLTNNQIIEDSEGLSIQLLKDIILSTRQNQII
jgi:chemotaxis protein methyltransferase CheR